MPQQRCVGLLNEETDLLRANFKLYWGLNTFKVYRQWSTMNPTTTAGLYSVEFSTPWSHVKAFLVHLDFSKLAIEVPLVSFYIAQDHKCVWKGYSPLGPTPRSLHLMSRYSSTWFLGPRRSLGLHKDREVREVRQTLTAFTKMIQLLFHR